MSGEPKDQIAVATLSPLVQGWAERHRGDPHQVKASANSKNMIFDPSFFIPLLFLGLLSGLLAGLLGVGGGLVIVPILAYLLPGQNVSAENLIQTSIGTALMVICFTSLSSLRAHHKAGAILWPVALKFTPGILLGSIVGAKIAHWLPGRQLGLFFSVFIVFSGVQMLLDKKPKPSRDLPGTTGLVAVGSVIGTLSSIVGAGGGFISVPFMAWCNVNLKNAVATSAAMGFPIAVFSSVGYIYNGLHTAHLPPWSLGYIYMPAVMFLAGMSVFTAPVGARLAHRLPVKTLKKVFAYMLFILAAMMFRKVF